MIGKVLSMTGRLIALFCAGLVVFTISTALAQTASPQDLPSLELDDISYTNWDLSEITVAAASAITNHPSIGNVHIAGGENDEFFRDGTNYTVYISEITDDNGIGGFSYQWYAGVDDGGVINTRRIVGATSAIYAYDSANVPSGTGQTVMIAAVTHVDYDGFAQTFTTTLHSGHLISVTANGLAAGDTISWRVAQRIVRERGYQTTLSATHRVERNGNIVDLADDTSEYVLADGITDFDSPYAVHMVREYTNTRVVKAAATLTVGITSTITVNVARNFNLLRPTQGEVTLSLIGSVIRYGAEITVVTTGVSDVNGGGFLPDQYVWQLDGVAIESATSSVYRLQLGDILAAEGGRLSALATHRDSLGYVATLAATLRAQNRIDLGDRAVSIVAADGLIRGSTLSLSIVNRQSEQSVGDNVEWRYCKYPRAQGVGGDCDAVHNEQQGAAGNMYVLLSKPSEERPYIVAEGEVVQASGTSSFTAVLLGRIPPVHPLRLVGDPDDQIGENEYFFDGSSRFSLYIGEDVYAHGAILNHRSQAQECSSRKLSDSACTGFFFIERSRQYFLSDRIEGEIERDLERNTYEFVDENIYGYSLPLDVNERAESYFPDSNGYLSAVRFYESEVFLPDIRSRRWTPDARIARGYGEQGDGGMTLTLYFAGGTHSQLVEDSFGEPLYVRASLENQYDIVDTNGAGLQIPYRHIRDRIGSDKLTLYSPGAIEQAVMIIGGEVTIGAVATLSINLLRAAHDTGSIEHTIFIGNRQVVSGDRLSAEYSYRLSTDDVLEMLINAPLNASLRYAHSKYRRGSSAGLTEPLIKELSSALTLTLNHNGVVTLQTSNGLLRGSTLSIDFGEESADDFYIDWWHCNAATLSVDGCVSAAGTTQGGDRGVIPDNGQAPFYVLDTVLSTIYSHIVARAGRYGAGGSDYLAAIAMPPQDSYTLSIAALSLNIVGAAEDLITPGAFLYDTDSVFSVTVLLSIDISQTPYGAFVKETGDISWNLNFLDVGNNENNVTINNSEIVTLSGFNGFDGDSYAQILSVTINGIVFADSYGASINMVSDNLDNINPNHQAILRRRISVTIDIEQNRVTLDDSAGRVWDAPSYQWQHRQLSADSWQNIAAPDESFWTLSEEQINDEDFGPYVRLQLTNEEEIIPGVVVTVRRYSNEILAGGIANPTPAADRIILAAADDSPCVVDAACDELRIGYVYTLAISDNVPLVNYLGQTLQMAYFNADTDVRWQRAVGADDEYRDLTTTLGRELFRYTINVSTLIDEDGTSYGFLRAKVTDNRGQQRNPEDRATPESVFYTQSFSPDFVGTGRVYIPSPYATEIFADGFTYTANIDGIEDVNGVGNFSYQWYAGADDNGVISVQPINGATSQSYIFDSADVSAAAGVTVLQVSVLHTDLAGYEQTFMATLHSGRILSLVAAGLSAGDIISAVTITQYLHERGLGGAQFGVPTWYIFNQQNPFAFLRPISSLPGDTGYTLAATDFNPSGEVVGDSVRNSYPFNYENGSGNEIYYSDLLIVNMSLTGALTMSLSGGIVAENATVTVLTAGVSDANGGGFISYEWLRGDATIAGEDESGYELTNDDLLSAATGKLSARAVYRDSLGFETELSAALSAVGDSVGTGTVTIVGAPSFADGGVYTADTSGVVDDNGIGDFSYQWYVNINNSVTVLGGETGATYTMELSDFVIGDAVNPLLVLSVSVLHTDAAGYPQDYEAVLPHADNVLSGNVELSLLGGVVTENATVTILTASVSDANGGGFISYEWLRDGATITGANESGYELTRDDLLSAATGKLSARAKYRDSLGFETELSAALLAVGDSIGTGTVTIIGAPSFADGGVYTADTSGVVDDNGIGDFGYQWYVNVNANVSLLLGETAATYTVKLSDFVTDNVENTVLGLSVSVLHTDAAGYTQDYEAVLPHADNVLSGNVELSLLGGIVAENATVTILTASVSDENGGGFISYEWLRGDVTIAGEDESDYELTNDDLLSAATGKLSVRAIYRDSLGFETALSAALSAVDDSVGTGTVTIVGADSFVHGGVYTVQTSGVVDANGIGEFDYQWYVYVNDVQERFAETASVLTLNIRGALRYNTSVKNPTIVLSVSVVHTDAAGYTQDYGAARLHEDIPLEGEITVSLFGGIVAENVTVTILTLGVSDANDGRFRLYEWLRDGVIIDGANNISYALTRADLTAAARGELSARAIYRDISGYETTLSAILPAVDDSEGVGTVTIVGAPSFTDGGIYTVQTSGVVDANGIGSFDYQWYVYFNDNVDEITGATVSVYTLQITPFLQLDTSFNNPTVGLSVSVVHTDAAGYTQDYGAARLHEDIPLEGEITVSLFGGIVAENATVTILTLGVSDANDGRFRLYEWLRDGVIIDGANNISYALTRADLTAAARGELSARAIYRDSLGFETELSAVLSAVGDSVGTGAVTINGAASFTDGAVYTAQTVNFRDANGIGDFGYQWYVNINNSVTVLAGETGATYTVKLSDFVTDNVENTVLGLSVSVLHTDAAGYTQDYEAVLPHADNVLSGNVELSLLGGIVAENATVTILTAGVSDENGGGFISYEWLRGDTTIASANESGYELTNDDLSAAAAGKLSARAIYRDSLGFETALSAALSAVDDSLGTGRIYIKSPPLTEIFADGGRYTADISGVEDANGIGSFSYQWYVGVDGVNGISLSPPNEFGYGGDSLRAQEYRYDSRDSINATGITVLQVSVTHTDLAGYEQTFMATLHSDNIVSIGVLGITAGARITSEIVEQYVIERGLENSELSYSWVSQLGSQVGAADSIGVNSFYDIMTEDFSPKDSIKLLITFRNTATAGTSIYFSDVIKINEPLSGGVSVSLYGGVVAENATVTVLTAGVLDANGGGFISYEWLRDGATIAGANESDYELTNDDLSAAATGKLSARAIYRDSLGFETELSAALSALGDSIGTGTVTIVGAPSFADGGVYTADTSDVVDDNGIGEFDYQWYANINNSVTVLGGETGATYTMELSDFVIGDAVNPLLVLSVSVLHTDAAGYTQDYEAVLPHADNVLSGNVELSLLGGIVTENATVTILTAGVSDANGGGFISYEWLRGDVTIAGANEIGYELTNDDLTAAAAGKLSARAIYRDSLGFETALSAALSAVGDSVGIGTVTIVGAPSFTDGGIYTVQTSGVVDANGIGDFSYQWYVNINNSVTVLAGETGATYTMELSDFVIGDAVNPSLVLSVSVLHTDAAGYTQDYEADLPHVDNVLSGNVELSLYGGVVAENATVTILTASVSDANGGGFISYEWLRDGATITGANESGYELTRDDLLSAATGKLSARAKYRDSLGFETELSAALLAVGDSIGTGTVTIIGAPSFADGGVYTADTSGVVDDNGIGDFGYQWYVNVNANVSLLLGETAATYTVKLSDFVTDNVENTVLGLSVSVLHTDAAGYTQDYEAVLPHADSVLSGNVELSLYGGVVAENATVTILTASVSDANGGGFISYEWLRGDVTIAGANESSYELTNDDLSAAATGKLSARAIYRDDLGFETELSAALLAVGDSVGTGTVTIVGAPSFADGEVYTADTSGVVDDNGIGDFGYQWYANVNANVSLLLGETAATYTVQLSDFVADGVVNTVLGLSVSVLHTDAAGYTRDYAATRLHADNVLSGNVELSLSGGIVAEGATVTLITAGVSDANGGGFISYKWLRDGVTIAGANASDYELTNDDLLSAATGKLSVRALYRDNLGFETELSAILPAAGDSVGTGAVTINGADSFAAGEVYTADTSGVRDANGIGSFVYQWYVNINDNVSLLSGETNATYKVQLSDFVTDNVENTVLGLSVSVLHTDAAGYTRDYDAVRLHADNVLSGNMELSLLGGIVSESAIITVLTAGVSDANGGGFISYEWLRDGVTIVGASASDYELTNDDLLSAATGKLSVRALYRDNLGFETELSATLPAAGDSVGTGAVTINGADSFAAGEVYTAETSGVRDENGIGDFGYQWYANVNDNVSLLSGETNATYKVQLSDFVTEGVVNTVLGLSVSVLHTDAAGYTRDYNAVRLHADNVLSGNVELSLLGDIVVAGATVTLITAGVSDNNGGGFISYEWLRDGVTITGANENRYELTNDDLLSAATGKLSVRALYRDSLGFETELSAALSAVGDSIGTGTVTIIGAPSFTEGAVYTAQTVDFRDANGIGSFDYQWYVNINNSVTVLASATAAIYTMALSDFVIGDDVLNPSLVLGVSVLHTDAAGYPQDYEAALPHADNVLSGNVELSLLGGIVAENATVTILTAGVSDNNGGGFISYEWLRGDATIAGEDASDYELTNDDLSAAAAGKLSARAIYRDSLGFETALSAALSAVGDSIGTGTVTIVGADSFAEGGVYTADTSGVVDDNGIGDFGYQWYANVNANMSLLLGETGATYTVKLSDFVTDNIENTLLVLSVSVLHTDAAGYTQDYEAVLPHADNVLSGNVELSLLGGIVAENATVTILTAGVSDANGGGFISYEWLRDGVTIAGASENRYELTSDDLLSAARGELSARAIYRDSLGFETALSAALSAVDDSIGTGTVTIVGAPSFTDGGIYTVQTSGVVDDNGIGDFGYQWYANVNANVSLLLGETGATYTVKLSNFVTDNVENTLLVLSVSVLHTDAAGYTRDYNAVLPHADNVLSGNVELSLYGGIVAEGAIVTVLTASVSDENGGGFISYEWLRDGATIAGANESGYELTSDDLSAAAAGKLSARALYRDDLGFNTELSAILSAADDSVGTGTVTIIGVASFAEGGVYTADTGGVVDDNGIGEFDYQWYANINNSVTVLVGETAVTYVVKLSDFVTDNVENTLLVLSVSVLHTDAAGYTQDYEAAIPHADNVLSGNVELSLLGGIVAENATVTVLTAGVSDENGGGFISYEWLRDGVTITGANENRYELTNDDLSAAAAGKLSARALYRDDLGFNTALSAALSALGDSIGTGTVTIVGASSFASGAVYTADTSGVVDDNGIGDFGYQWYANVNANVSLLLGETGATYTVKLSDFVTDNVENTVLGLSVSVLHTDAAGYTQDYEAVLPHADISLTGNVELSLLGGIVAEGATVMLITASVSDNNGGGFISYEWLRDGATIAGANENRYELTNDDLTAAAAGKLSARAIYRDDLGFETALSAALSAVGDSIGTGTVTIVGAVSFASGEVYTADTSGVVDDNGIGDFGYQWYVNINNSVTVLAGETGVTYTMELSDFVIGDAVNPLLVLSVSVLHTDAAGYTRDYNAVRLHADNVLSGNVELSLSGDIVAEGATVMLITAGVSDANGGGFISYEWLRGDVTIAGANESSYELTNDDLSAAATGKLSARAIYRDDLGFETELSAALLAVGDSVGTGTVTIVGAPSFADGEVYTADTSGVVDDNGIGDFGYQWYANVNANVSLLLGETGATYTVKLSHFVTDNVENTSLVLSVSVLHMDAAGYTQDYEAVLPHVDNVLSGNVELSLLGGIVSEGAMVTVLTAGVSDENGGGFISYEWLRDGATIAGASKSDYELTNDDLLSAATGKLSARAIYRDDLGFETELSAALSAVGDSIGTGTVTIEGSVSFTEGAVYTAQTVNFRDANGIGSFSYQWYANVNDNVSLLSGETGATYTVKLSDFVADGVINTVLGLSVLVLHTDAIGLYTQDYDAILLHNDLPLSGALKVSLSGGVVAENATVIVLTAGVSDANGGGFVSTEYEWLRGNATITGANESRYELTSDDLSAAAAGKLSARALYRDDLGFNTELSAVLSAVGDSVGTGAVTINGAASFTDGAVYTAQTVDFRDANGIGDFSYQWYVNINNSVTVLVGETGATYTMALSDFVIGDDAVNPSLVLGMSVVHTDGANNDQIYEAVLSHVDIPLTGSLTISLSGGVVAENATVTILTAGVADANGGGFISYEWLRGDITITGASASSYELTEADLTTAARGGLSARALYRDDLGFNTALSAVLSAVDDRHELESGKVEIRLTGYVFNQNEAMAHIQGIADSQIAEVSYQWQTGIGAEFAEFRNVGEHGDLCLLESEHFNPQDSLRVIANITGISGHIVQLTSAVVPINFDVAGDVIIRVIGNGPVVAGAVLSADISNLYDQNGELLVGENIWLSGASDAPVAVGFTYTLVAGDIDHGRVKYRGVVNDPALFATTFENEVNTGRIDSRQVRVLLESINVAADDGIARALNDHLNTAADGLHINGATVEDSAQLAKALLSGRDQSANGNRFWGINEFSLNSSEGAPGEEWSWWVRGYRTHLKGTPSVGGETFDYNGDYKAFYAGLDRRLHRDVIIGMILSSDLAKLDVDWNTGVTSEGSIRQDMLSIVPYAEWSPDENTALRIYGGYGRGDLRINVNDVETMTDSERKILGLQGIYRLSLSTNWEMSWRGDVSYVRGAADEVSRVLEGVTARHGESRLNWEIAHTTIDPGKAYWRKFLNLRWRKQFGELDNVSLYDIGGGFSWAMPSHNFRFGVSGQWQLNTAEHMRESFDIYVTFGPGKINHTMRTRYSGVDGGFNHRYEIGMVSDWGISTIYTNVYAERRYGGELYWGGDMELEF